MRTVVSLLCTVVLSCPAPLFAQDLGNLLKEQPALELVPKPTPAQCGDAKCFDLEDYKRYLQMRTQYLWLFKVHTGLMPALVAELKKIDALKSEVAKVQEERAERYQASYDELFPKYINAIQEAERAKATSIFGGGLTWVIVTGVSGVLLGFVGGLWLSGKLTPVAASS